MSAGHPPGEEGTLFRPRFAAETDPDSGTPLWPVLRRAMVGGISLQRTWLVRWNAGSDDDGRARTLGQDIRAQSPQGTVCLRYDATAILVLVAGDDWPGANAMQGPGEDLQLWQAVAVSDEGIHFRKFATAARTQISDQMTAPAGPQPSKLVLSDAEHTYFPLWDVAANQIFAYLCRAAWSAPGGRTLDEGSPEIRSAAPERLAAIDLTLFRAATSFVQDTLDNYGSVDIVIPIHCGVFSSPRAVSTLYDTVAREIWPVLENVYFELIPGPAPNAFRNVDAAIAQMADYGRRLMIRVGADDDLSEIPAADWLSVGLQPPWPVVEGDVTPQLDDFADRIRDRGYGAHVFGLTGMPETVAALNAGFTYVGSDAIATPLTGNDDVQAQPADILKAILASRATR